MDSYTADAWRTAFNCVSSDWEEYVPEWAAESAIRSAYHDIKVINGNEEVVAATIEAAASLWQSWEPAAFLGFARSFMCAYPDMDTVKDEYIRENYPGTEVSWFKDDAPVWDGMSSSDELMIEVNGAVYIFARPGTQRYATLSTRLDRTGECKNGSPTCTEADPCVLCYDREAIEYEYAYTHSVEDDDTCDDGCGKHVDHKVNGDPECGPR